MCFRTVAHHFVIVTTFVIAIIFVLSSDVAQAATRTVTSPNNAGAGTLRQAIADATDGDRIVFSSTIASITLTAEIAITISVHIDGPNADELDISGGSSARIFDINATGDIVTISGVSLINGRSQATPINFQIAGGGAIFHRAGTLLIDECEFEGNVCDDGNGTTSFGYGGAIVCQADMTVSNTLFTGNSLNNSNAYGGGAVYVQESAVDNVVEFNNCTFVNNSVVNGNSDAIGGGIYLSENISTGGGTAPIITIVNCTFFDNDANQNGEHLGMFSNGNVEFTLQNNIFDRSTTGGGQVSVDCGCIHGVTANSNGGNIYWDTPDSDIPTSGTRDIVAQGLGGSGISGTLALNGGPTRTLAIDNVGDAANNNGTSGGDVLARDQRDFTRLGNPDAGAFEFGGSFSFDELTPADNETGVAVSSDLTINFDHNVTVGTGNIEIRRVVGGSLVESMAVNGARVSGSGTKNITIDPSAILPGNTALYVNYPTSAFDAPLGEANLALSDNSTWSFTTGAVPDLPPTISTTNTIVNGRAGEALRIYVTISDAETATAALVVSTASSDISIVPTANIVQVSLTRATTCFRITSASAQATGAVVLSFTVSDSGANVASTSFNVSFSPALPDRLAFSTLSPNGNEGWNQNDAGGLGNRFIVQVGANANRESADIIATSATFNAFGDLSPPDLVVPTEYSLFTGFGGAGIGDGAGAADPTFGPAVSSTANTLRVRLQSSVARGANLTLATAAGAPIALATTTISMTVLVPPAVQLGLTSTFGNTGGAQGDGVGIDGFNNGQTVFQGSTSITVTIGSLDAANYLAATGNNTFPIFFFSTTISASVNNPDVVLSGPGTTLTLSTLTATNSGVLNIDYSGAVATQAIITYRHEGSGELGTTSLSISLTPTRPTLATSNTAITMPEDGSTRLYVSVSDVQSATSLIVLAASSGNIAIVPTANIVQLSNPTSAITCFALNGATNANGPVNISIRGSDPDGNTGSVTFTVNLTPVNDEPSFMTGANVALNEGAAPYDQPFATGIDDGDPELAQNLSFHILNDNPALFATQPSIAVSTGNLSFALHPATTGVAVLDVSLSDDGGTGNGGDNTTASQRFRISVANLNDAPVFTTGANVVVAEDSGPYDQPFATGIDDGDPSTSQSLSFHVVATNQSLFAVQPAITTTGQLRFTPADNANGTTNVRVSLSDDGPNGGGDVNTSATQTFSISLTPVNDPPTISLIGDVAFPANSTTSVSFSIADIDDAIATLIVTASSANQALITNGGLSFSATSAVMTMTIRPNCGASGIAALTVQVEDCGAPALTSTATFQASVTPAASFSIVGPAAPCPLTAVEYSIPPMSGATYSWNISNGILLSGQGTTRASVNWASATTGTVAATITTPAGCTFGGLRVVTSGAATANPDFVATSAGSSVDFNVLSNDVGTGLSLISATQPANGLLTTNANGNVSYTPDSGFEGFDIFTYTIRDAGGCIVTGASVEVVIGATKDVVNLKYIERAKDRSGGVRGLRKVAGLGISPDGAHVYAAGKSDHSLAMFARTAADGTLQYLGRVRNNKNGVKSMSYPSALVVSPNGKHVYVAAYGGKAVVSFERNTSTGTLSFLERKVNGQRDAGRRILGISRPINLALSPDGKSLYVTGYSDNSLAVFRRDPVSGLLQFLERHRDGAAGVDGLRLPLGLAVSPDGCQVYAAGFGDDALAIFARDKQSGELTFSGHLRDGKQGVEGIAQITDIAPSADGRHIYASGFGDKAVAAFKRSDSGQLSFIERVSDAAFDGIRAVVVAPAGGQVFSAAEKADAVAVLCRDSEDGSIEFVEALRDGQGGVDGLNRATDLIISGDSRHLYVAGSDDNAVAAIYRNRHPQAHDDGPLNVALNGSEIVSALSNDIERDSGETLSISAKTDGTLGSVAITGGGTTLSYSAGGTAGVDTFSYTIDDGQGGSSTATVSVTIVHPKRGADFGRDRDGCEKCLRVSPNPLRDKALVKIYLAEEANVQLEIVDLSGHIVSKVWSGKLVSGEHHFNWKAESLSGALLPAAAYLLRLRTETSAGRVHEESLSLRIIP